MTPQYKYSLLNTKEATYYLEVSSFKFKKLIKEGHYCHGFGLFAVEKKYISLTPRS